MSCWFGELSQLGDLGKFNCMGASVDLTELGGMNRLHYFVEFSWLNDFRTLRVREGGSVNWVQTCRLDFRHTCLLNLRDTVDSSCVMPSG